MATSGVATWCRQHGLQIAQSIATYMLLSYMSVFRASIQRMKLEIISLLPSNTAGGITIYIECTAMPIPRQPMLDSRRAMFTHYISYVNVFHVSGAASQSPTPSIPWSSVCLTTCSCGFSTSWRHTNGLTSTMESAYLCLLNRMLHKKISQLKKFFNAMGKRWRTWASTSLELYHGLYEVEALLSFPYRFIQLWADRHCQNSVYMLDIKLTIMQHWATWRALCVIFHPPKMFSY